MTSRASQLRGFLALVALSLLSVLGLWLLSGRQSNRPVPTPPTLSSPGASAPAATTRPTAGVTAFDAASVGFEVPFTFTYDWHWYRPNLDLLTGVVVPGRNDFWISFQDRSPTAYLTVFSIAHVLVQPQSLLKKGLLTTDFAEMKPWPADMHAWLASLPGFIPSAANATVIAGYPATIVDTSFVFALSPKVQAGELTPNVINVADGGIIWPLDPGEWHVVEIRTGPSSGLLFVMGASPGVMADATRALDSLLESLTFD